MRLFAELRGRKAALGASQVDALLGNVFLLVNRRFKFGGPVDWHRRDLNVESPLAGFELHYQGYLEDLALAWQRTREAGYARKVEELLRSWLEGNTSGNWRSARFSWSPYVIAERIRNWLSSLYWLHHSVDGSLKRLLESSVAEQTAFLANNLEYHLQGNHLWQNLCGLVVAACVLEGGQARKVRQTGLVQLARVVEEQVLADGMHEERSFLYHLKALWDLLDVLTVVEAGAPDRQSQAVDKAVRSLREAAAQMAGLIASTFGELGGLPLMNDCDEIPCQNAELAVAEASRLAGLRRPSADERCRGSGYLVGSVHPWSVVFDVGAAAPDHQMGHAHADHLSLEVWHADRKLISDSGNVTYNPGQKRDYYRGTAAHNTVRVDQEDSLEIWGSFRVGRRPRRHKGAILTNDDDHILWAGEHDGFAHLPGRPVHRRLVELRAQGMMVHDRIAGRGRHLVETFLSFHPSVAVESCPGQEVDTAAFALPARLAKGRQSVWRWRDGGSAEGLAVAVCPEGCALEVEKLAGAYAPRQSLEFANTVLRMAGTVALPVDVGWLVLAAGSSVS